LVGPDRGDGVKHLLRMTASVLDLSLIDSSGFFI